MRLRPPDPLRRTPFRALHPRLGTETAPSGGWEMPLLPTVGRHPRASTPKDVDAPFPCETDHGFFAHGAN